MLFLGAFLCLCAYRSGVPSGCSASSWTPRITQSRYCTRLACLACPRERFYYWSGRWLCERCRVAVFSLCSSSILLVSAVPKFCLPRVRKIYICTSSTCVRAFLFVCFLHHHSIRCVATSGASVLNSILIWLDTKKSPWPQVEMDVREYLDQVRIEASVKAVDMSDVKFNREVYRQHVDHHQENQALNNMGVR